MERRSALEIAAEILSIASEGAKKTHIVYQANLNHAILGHHLDRLERQGLITVKNGPGNRTSIKTTEKGLQFVERYRNLQALTNS